MLRRGARGMKRSTSSSSRTSRPSGPAPHNSTCTAPLARTAESGSRATTRCRPPTRSGPPPARLAPTPSRWPLTSTSAWAPRIAHPFLAVFCFSVARSTLARAVTRLGEEAEPVYAQIAVLVRTSRVVYPDETGCKSEASRLGCGISSASSRGPLSTPSDRAVEGTFPRRYWELTTPGSSATTAGLPTTNSRRSRISSVWRIASGAAENSWRSPPGERFVFRVRSKHSSRTPSFCETVGTGKRSLPMAWRWQREG